MNNRNEKLIAKSIRLLKIVNMVFIIGNLGTFIYQLTRTGITTSWFSSVDYVFSAEIILGVGVLIIAGTVIIWPKLLRYSRNNTAYILAAQLMRASLVEAIGLLSIALGVLGSTGLIKVVMPVAALVILLVQYPTPRKLQGWDRS